MTESRAERAATRILNAIPGYSGYRDKESRRDADRAVRNRLASDLNQRAERVEGVARQLAEQRRIHDVGPVNAFAGAVRHLANRINTATYGYGGLFSNNSVDAAVLDQIRLFDESLFAGIEQIDNAITRLDPSNENLAQSAAEGQRVVEKIGERLEQRNRIVDSAIPASPEQMSNVLAVLQSPEALAEAQSPPAAYELHDRDAIAVLGDNYVVDARIDIQSAGGFYRLFRVDVAPDTWLLVPRLRGQAFARLTSTAEAYQDSPEPSIAGESYEIVASGTGSGDVIGAGGQTGQRPLAYTLLRGVSDSMLQAVVLRWGTEQQVLTGSEIHPTDVEIFGRPS